MRAMSAARTEWWSLSQKKLLCNTQRKARVTGQLQIQHNHQSHPASVISGDTLHGRALGRREGVEASPDCPESVLGVQPAELVKKQPSE